MNSHSLITILKRHIKEPKSLLIGYSGGPDSLALLHMLLKAQSHFPFEIALAHVDHGWRKESEDEALQISEMAKRLKLKLHLKKLDVSQFTGNLEAACRSERLRFFSELCNTFKYDAILLGHHADDQAETVLKRIFEGASLTMLSAIQEVSTYEGMKILRPLLKLTKKEILKWLENENLVGFYDKTNDDQKFLRARMRKSTFPLLEMSFGKDVKQSLRSLSDESEELREYLTQKTSPILKAAIKGPWGKFFDLKSLYFDKKVFEDAKVTNFELKFLVKQLAVDSGMFLSRENLLMAVDFLVKNSANKKIITGALSAKKILYIDRMRLFLIERPLPSLQNESIKLTPELTIGETINFGGWQATLLPFKEDDLLLEKNNPLRSNHQFEGYQTNWKSIWQGDAVSLIPSVGCKIAAPNPAFTLAGRSTSLDKLWTSFKVPSILRTAAPLVLKGNEVVCEFLSGSNVKDKFESKIKPRELCRLKLTFFS